MRQRQKIVQQAHRPHSPFLRVMRLLRCGKIIAYPTETIWGLGCAMNNLQAVRRLRLIKARKPEQGFILIAGTWKAFAPYFPHLSVQDIEKVCKQRARPCSWAVKNTGRPISKQIRGDNDKVVLRISRHPQVQRITLGGAIVSTSANPAGLPPAKTAKDVKAYFGKRIDYIVPGYPGTAHQASRICDLETGDILRN